MSHRSSSVPLFLAWLPLLLSAAILLPAPARSANPATPPAELLLRGGDGREDVDATLLSPSSAIEVRFAADMVAPEQRGKPGAESPLVITPPLAGTFLWTSLRGGVYTFSEAPPLGASYEVRLHSGLKTADGEPIHAEVSRSYHTPPLEIEGRSSYYFGDPHRDEPGPRVQLLFNSAVDPARIAPALSFQNSSGGAPVPVNLRPATEKDDYPFDSTTIRRTWLQRFITAHSASTAQSASSPSPVVNRVIVTPEKPLPPGKHWKLVVAAGLRGLDPGALLPSPQDFPVGNITSFEVKDVASINDGVEARKLVVHFSRRLDKEVTADTIGRWLQVSPVPTHLKFDVPTASWYTENFSVEITGDFEAERDYTVTARAGLPSVGHFYTLAADATRSARFESEPPQLAFPDFNVAQLASGRREFTLKARNASRVHLRAKLVPPEEAALALITYDKTNFHGRGDGYTEGARVDFDRVPGQVVFDQQIPGSKALDTPEIITLHWDEILGPHRDGVVFLEAEQPTPTPGQKQRAGVQSFVQVTDLGIVWKTSPGGKLLTYVFSMRDGQPVRAKVRPLDAAGHPIYAKQELPASREDGVTLLPPGSDQAAFLAVTTGDDCHVLPFKPGRRNSLGLYRYHLPDSAFPPDDEDTSAADDDDEADGDTPAAKDKTTPPKPPRREMLLFTERGVYKPGEQAHLKGIVREWRDGGLVNVPPNTPATLRAYDAKGRRFWQKDTRLSSTGSVAETIPLPTSTLGRYRVEISFDGKPDANQNDPDEAVNDHGSSGSSDADDSDDDDGDPTPNVCRFQVQEYQPNAFEVKLTKPAQPPVGPGEVPVPLQANYYMGKALSHAKTVWSLKADDTDFTPKGFDDYIFGSQEADGRFDHHPGELALDGQGDLSDHGALMITPRIVLNPASPTPRSVHLQASVTDQDQQTVTAHASFVVHSSDLYLGLRAMPEVLRAGDPLPLEIVAVQSDDEQPCAAPVQVTAKLSLINWRTNRVANDSGNSDYDSHADLSAVNEVRLLTTNVHRVGKLWEPVSEADTLLAATGQPPAGGAVVPAAAPVPAGTAANLVPKDPGEYLLEVTCQDKSGRAVRTATTFDVLGDHEAEWGYRNASQLPLVPDKAEYHAGDRATLLVKTPISGRALVTVEREGVSRAFIAEVAKEHPVVQVPILPGDAPNVFVSVLLMRGAEQSPRRVKEPEYRTGYCQLLVPKTDTRLDVVVQPGRPEYLPGEQATVEVAVMDAAHHPAAGAEVTLYAVDKGVLSLTGYALPEPLKAFYHPRPLEVTTGLTLPDLLSEDPDDLNFSGDKGYAANKGYLVGGGGELGRGDRLRQNFVACAYWNASLVTDSEGHITAHFPTPDSLTEYEVMAVVQEGGETKNPLAAGRFGAGEGSFRVNKPLMLEPALPRFGNVGDHLLLRAVVHNQSPSDGEAEVTLDLDGTAALDAPDTATARVRHVSLTKGESKTVDFPVVFTHTGDAAWTWHARLVGSGATPPVWTDAVQSTLHVDHPTPRRAEVVAKRLEHGEADDLLAHVNPEIMEGEDGVIQVNVSTTRLGELGEGVDALLHYPYGCVEQTTSSLMPWLALKDFQEVLPQLRHTPQQVEDAVAHGVNRLVGMQTESGGLAYWPDVTGREPHPWGSAYGGLGLALAKRAGYFVPQESFNKLCSYLSDGLRSDKPAVHDTYHDHNETDKCLALYALALAGKGEPAYYEKYYARRAELSPEDRTLLALAITEDRGSSDMVRDLLQPTPRDHESPSTWSQFASTSSLDGMRLLAWCRYQPLDAGVEDRITRLLDDRNGEGNWDTTQGNAWSILAMSAYAQQVEKPGRTMSGTVTLGGKSQSFNLKGKLSAFNCELPLETAATDHGKLNVSSPGGGNLYVQAKVESRPRGGAALTAHPTSGQGGYTISRSYEKLLDDGSRTDARDLQVGDRVLVTLEIESPDRASYVAVNDPLPAVLEAVNPEFKTSGAGGNAPKQGFDWWISDFRELRADRALFFCDALYSGHFHLQYLARVRAAGTATAPAAKIEEMYHPDHYAETAAASLTSKPLE